MTSLQRDARVQEIEERLKSATAYEEASGIPLDQSYHDLRFLLDQVAALQAENERLVTVAAGAIDDRHDDAERLDWLGANHAPALARLLKRPFEEMPLIEMPGGDVFKADSLRVWIDAARSPGEADAD